MRRVSETCTALQDYIPGQQFVDPLDRMIGDAGDDIAEIGFRIEAVELGRFDEGVHRRGAFAAAVGTGEQPVFASQSQRPDGALGGVVADVEPAVGRITGQRVPSGRA